MESHGILTGHKCTNPVLCSILCLVCGKPDTKRVYEVKLWGNGNMTLPPKIFVRVNLSPPFSGKETA